MHHELITVTRHKVDGMVIKERFRRIDIGNCLMGSGGTLTRGCIS